MVSQSDFSSTIVSAEVNSALNTNNNSINKKPPNKNWFYRNWLGLVILLITFLLLWFILVLISNLFKIILKNNSFKQKLIPTSSQKITKTIKNECFSFNYYGGAKDNIEQKDKCSVSISSYFGKAIINISENNGVTEPNLKQYADLDKKDLISIRQSLETEMEGTTKFAGLPAYQFVVKDNEMKIIFNYIYRRSSITSKFYRMSFFLVDLDSSFPKEVEESWKWLDDNKYSTPIKTYDSGVFNTPCYSIQLKTAVREKYKINDCDLELEFQNDKSVVGIHRFADPNANLEKAISDWKRFNKDYYFIILEKKIKVGNNDAYQIVYKPSKEIQTTLTIVFIYTGNKYEKIFGYPVNGFELFALYNYNSEIKSNIDYLLSHWTWL